ncbi:MAG: 16S rRNA (cytidine(1402)-2'-O)-methyltransferase [Pseudanabaenaceae cyanobacterium bins.68]|nr:16S rRNA (cytidine(1402)-2'-O)-methyltransferase [Pseudanabaenaceae cyanobacterium bins.68]
MGESKLALGTLYLVGTPIGNLEDMTARAIKTLQQVDLIAAEDTRHTGRLLQFFQITTPTISYHSHNTQERLPQILTRLEAGEAIALVSDAGMPGISDPGTELVQACIQHQINVIPIPGVTAAITALVTSGLDTSGFSFLGFLSQDHSQRRSQLTQIKASALTLILYEAPHKLLRTLHDLGDTLEPERQLVLGRELTKLHEEFWRGSLAEALSYFTDHVPRGEFTLVIAGRPFTPSPIFSDQDLINQLQQLIDQGMSRSQASRELAEALGISRRQVYQLALGLPD